METWRLLAGVSLMLVVWAGLVTALGQQPGPLGLVVAMVFAVLGLYLGEAVTHRLGYRDEDR